MPGFHPSYRRGARQPLSSLQRTLGGHVAGLMPHEYQSNVKGWQPAGSSAAAGKRGRAAAAARAVPDFDVAADSGDDHDETPRTARAAANAMLPTIGGGRNKHTKRGLGKKEPAPRKRAAVKPSRKHVRRHKENRHNNRGDASFSSAAAASSSSSSSTTPRASSSSAARSPCLADRVKQLESSRTPVKYDTDEGSKFDEHDESGVDLETFDDLHPEEDDGPRSSPFNAPVKKSSGRRGAGYSVATPTRLVMGGDGGRGSYEPAESKGGDIGDDDGADRIVEGKVAHAADAGAAPPLTPPPTSTSYSSAGSSSSGGGATARDDDDDNGTEQEYKWDTAPEHQVHQGGYHHQQQQQQVQYQQQYRPEQHRDRRARPRNDLSSQEVDRRLADLGIEFESKYDDTTARTAQRGGSSVGGSVVAGRSSAARQPPTSPLRSPAPRSRSRARHHRAEGSASPPETGRDSPEPETARASQFVSNRSPAAAMARLRRMKQEKKRLDGSKLRPQTPPRRASTPEATTATDGEPYEEQYPAAAVAEVHHHHHHHHHQRLRTAREHSRSRSPAAAADSGYDIIFSRARHNRMGEVRKALDGGMPVDTRDKHGNTLLHVACQNGNKKLVKALLRKHANIDATNQNGNTGLHFCFMYAYYGLGEYLISKGANDGLRNADGATPYEADR